MEKDKGFEVVESKEVRIKRLVELSKTLYKTEKEMQELCSSMEEDGINIEEELDKFRSIEND